MDDSSLRHSPLYEAHVERGAKMVGFGGWEMPLSFPSGTVAEHRACRTSAVVFDVSHLGTVRLEGDGVFELLQRTLTNDLARIRVGRAQYSHLLSEDGSVLDDVIVWWIAPSRFDVMPNASNTARVRAATGGRDTTGERAVIAAQGPKAREVLAAVAPEAAAVERFSVAEVAWRGRTCVAAGTGYTGEDGVECAVPGEAAKDFWEAMLAAGALPAGLGARDTLRLEAGFPLHGHELGPGITPIQAGLSWVVGWKKGPFPGREALEAERAKGPARQLRGLLAEGRQPPRDGAEVMAGGKHAGTVTSGNFSPMLERGIGLAFVDTAAALSDGDAVTVSVRGREIGASVVRPPFWRGSGTKAA